MKVIQEIYDVIGFKKNVYACEKCGVNMERTNEILLNNPMTYQAQIKCPKCGATEFVDVNTLNGQWLMKKKDDKGVNEDDKS